MERNGTEFLAKRNSKFETFLRRKFDNDTFERIRYHEACVVCSDREDKQFKYVVLGPEWIYLTENPPRTIREEVNFKDVISVELKNDIPDFLMGDMKNNTIHVVIKYSVQPKNQKGKKDSQRVHSPTPSYEGRSPLLSLPSFAIGGTSPILRKKLSSDQYRRNGSWNDEAYLKSSSGSSNFEDDLSSDDDDSGSSGFSRSINDEKGIAARKVLPFPRSDALKKSDLLKTEALQLSPRSSLYERRLSSRRSNIDVKLDIPELKLNHVKSMECLHSPNPDTYPELTKLKKTRSEAILTVQIEPPSRRASEDDTKDSKSQCSDESTHSLRISTGDYQPLTSSDDCESSLHLYMLNRNSPLLNFARSAWDNYTIRATLLLDDVFAEKEAYRSSGQVEKLDTLFVQLKQDILNAEKKIEDLFNLVNELKIAAEKNFALKKLFWRTPELFQFIVKQVELYARSPVADHSQRADELELINLLLETLCLVLREMEICPSRLRVMKTDCGKYVLKLLNCIARRVELPEKYVPLTHKAAKLLMQTDANKMHCIANAEIDKLSAEFTKLSTTILYEIILTAKQANWEPKHDNFFTIRWIVKSIIAGGTKDDFLGQMLLQAINLISPSQAIELEPFEAILVYHQFCILHTIIDNHPDILKFIRCNFMEEFKYYIQAPVIRAKLPLSYPISSSTLRLIEKVASKVLQKDIVLCRH